MSDVIYEIKNRCTGKVLFSGEFESMKRCVEAAVDANANLRRTDLRGADLLDADLDFATWPLWCGSLDTKADDRISAQLLYHVLRSGDNEVTRKLRSLKTVRDLANKFHRAEELGLIKEQESEKEQSE
jgi:hypothetical protein